MLKSDNVGIISDSRLLSMAQDVEASYGKRILFVYDPRIKEKSHGWFAEYADCIVVMYALDGEDGGYVTAHELAHALRGSANGSLQLEPSMRGSVRRIPTIIWSILEHPSVVKLTRDYGFAPDAIFARRARAILDARLADDSFTSGKPDRGAFDDIAMLAEYLGVYLCAEAQDLVELYSRVRPGIISPAKAVDNIIKQYTNDSLHRVEAATLCADIMNVSFIADKFVLRDANWSSHLQNYT